jgi:pimeloyl-ACP methyl ester carboxylesterase
MPRNTSWSRPPLLLLALSLSAVSACGDDGNDGQGEEVLDSSITTPPADDDQQTDGGAPTGIDAATRRDAGRDSGRPPLRDSGADGSTDAGDAGGQGDADLGPSLDAGELDATTSDAASEDAAPPVVTPDARVPDAAVVLPPGCDAVVADDKCDQSKRPIVFVHGRLGAGDHFSNPAALFASNGYCPDRIRAIDYNSLAGDGAYAQLAGELDSTIASLLTATGAAEVDLVAHTEGANHAATYVAANAEKIARYVHIAGDRLGEDPAGVPTLCLSSSADAAINCATTKNVVFNNEDIDVFAVAASRETFVELYSFLNGGTAPTFQTVQCGSTVTLEGRAVSFGDNALPVGARVEIYELGNNARQRNNPVYAVAVPSDGRIGPFTAKRDVPYEFKLIAPPDDDRATRRVYYPAFKRSDRLLRLLFAAKDPDAASASRQINYDDNHAVLVVKRRSGAFLAGRDRLLIGGSSVLTEQNAGRTMTTIGLYLYDQAVSAEGGPGNGRSEGGAIVLGPYVSGSDLFLRADPPAYIDITFNGQRLRVPNWPSRSEGLSLVMVD